MTAPLVISSSWTVLPSGVCRRNGVKTAPVVPAPPPPPERACTWCGALFVSNYLNKQRCSINCSVRSQAHRQKAKRRSVA